MNRLLEPATIAGVTLKNHIVMAPLTRQRADQRGVPMPFVADYYAQRAGAGLIISEGTPAEFCGPVPMRKAR